MYDSRIAHAAAALTLRAYKVRQSSVAGMLTPIQFMEDYLRTGFGESTTFSGGAEDPKTGGMPGQHGGPRHMAADQLGVSKSTGQGRSRDPCGDTHHKEK